MVDSAGADRSMQIAGWDEENLIEDLTSRPRRSPQKRLEQMIEFDEEQAAAVLKQWIHQEGGGMMSPIGLYLAEFAPPARPAAADREASGRSRRS